MAGTVGFEEPDMLTLRLQHGNVLHVASDALPESDGIEHTHGRHALAGSQSVEVAKVAGSFRQGAVAPKSGRATGCGLRGRHDHPPGTN